MRWLIYTRNREQKGWNGEWDLIGADTSLQHVWERKMERLFLGFGVKPVILGSGRLDWSSLSVQVKDCVAVEEQNLRYLDCLAFAC
jgi:hypothetical protein